MNPIMFSYKIEQKFHKLICIAKLKYLLKFNIIVTMSSSVSHKSYDENDTNYITWL